MTFAADSSGKMTEGDVPAAMADEAKIAREQLIEMVAEADETLMETFFAEGTLTQEQLVSGLRAATVAGRLFPLVCTSGLHVIGIQPLLDALVAYVRRRRSATSRCWQGRRRDVGQGERQRALHGVRVEDDRRSVRRPHHDAARRVGALKSDTTVHNFTHDSAERLGHLIALQGKTHTHVPELKAGDLGAVAKLKETKTNDVLAEKSAAVKFTEIKFPSRCSPTRSSRRAAATRTRSARQCSGCGRKIPRSATPATRRPTNCCWPGRASSTSRSRSPS